MNVVDVRELDFTVLVVSVRSACFVTTALKLHGLRIEFRSRVVNEDSVVDVLGVRVAHSDKSKKIFVLLRPLVKEPTSGLSTPPD